MANDFKFEPVFRKKPFPLENERKKSLDDEFKNVEVLFGWVRSCIDWHFAESSDLTLPLQPRAG